MKRLLLLPLLLIRICVYGLDIFSCKPFEIEIARGVVQEYLNPNKIKVTYLARQA